MNLDFSPFIDGDNNEPDDLVAFKYKTMKFVHQYGDENRLCGVLDDELAMIDIPRRLQSNYVTADDVLVKVVIDNRIKVAFFVNSKMMNLMSDEEKLDHLAQRYSQIAERFMKPPIHPGGLLYLQARSMGMTSFVSYKSQLPLDRTSITDVEVVYWELDKGLGMDYVTRTAWGRRGSGRSPVVHGFSNFSYDRYMIRVSLCGKDASEVSLEPYGTMRLCSSCADTPQGQRYLSFPGAIQV